MQEVTLASLLRHLSSINEGVQLTALATCGKVTSVGIAYLVTSNEHSNTDLSTSDNLSIPEGYTTVMKQLTEALEKLLDSESIPVQVGTAIVLCALGVINNEVRCIVVLSTALTLLLLDRGDPPELPHYSSSCRMLGSSTVSSSHWYLSSCSNTKTVGASSCFP